MVISNGWKMKYSYAPLKTGEFRVLELLPGAGTDLAGKLQTTTFAEHPKYEAVSYCWGQGSSESISLDGKHVEVTTSLASALRVLRLKDRGRLLWADQICINQENKLEKNEQVGRMMGSIFAKTDQLLIWLGEADSESASSIRTIKKVYRELDDLRLLQDNIAQDLSTWDPRSKDGSLDVGTWHAVFRFLKRPWFSRVWVVQEVFLPETKNLRVHCGDDQLPWLELSAVHSVTRRFPWKQFGFAAKPLLDETTHPGELPLHLTVQLLRNLKAQPSVDCTLLANVFNFCNRSCTDPRDKVFAIKNVCVDPLVDTLEIDYSKEVTEIFTDVARNMITQYGNLDVLGACQLTRNVARLPSWVPDWTVSHERRPTRPMTLFYPRGNVPRYKALPPQEPKVLEPFQKGELRIYGYPLQSVLKVSSDRGDSIWHSSKMTDPIPFFREAHVLSGRDCQNIPLKIPSEERLEEIWPSSNRKRALHDTLILTTQEIQQAERLGNLHIAPKRRLELEKLLDEAWALSNKPRLNREVNSNALISAFLILRPPDLDPFPEDSALWTTLIMGKEDYNRFAEPPVNPKNNQAAYVHAFLQAVSGRKFFVTDDGDIGMGPYEIQPGDIVCLFPGATTPFVLRKSAGHWILIGECYCHSYMDGMYGQKLFENGKVELFSII